MASKCHASNNSPCKNTHNRRKSNRLRQNGSGYQRQFKQLTVRLIPHHRPQPTPMHARTIQPEHSTSISAYWRSPTVTKKVTEGPMWPFFVTPQQSKWPFFVTTAQQKHLSSPRPPFSSEKIQTLTPYYRLFQKVTTKLQNICT